MGGVVHHPAVNFGRCPCRNIPSSAIGVLGRLPQRDSFEHRLYGDLDLAD